MAGLLVASHATVRRVWSHRTPIDAMAKKPIEPEPPKQTLRERWAERSDAWLLTAEAALIMGLLMDQANGALLDSALPNAIKILCLLYTSPSPRDH
jgi:hypothetical protein